MKKINGLIAKTLCVTPVLCALCNIIVAYAEEITTRSIYPLWYAEPEVPKILLEKIR